MEIGQTEQRKHLNLTPDFRQASIPSLSVTPQVIHRLKRVFHPSTRTTAPAAYSTQLGRNSEQVRMPDYVKGGETESTGKQ